MILKPAFVVSITLAACGGSTSSGNPDAPASPDATVANPDAATPSRQPPAAGPSHPGDGTGAVTFAVTRLYLGDTDPNGTPDKVNGWKQFGYDLDGKQSTSTSTDLCQLRNNASPKNVYPDGDDGIDNAFGKLVLPILLGIASDASQAANSALNAGKPRYLIHIAAMGASDGYNPLAAASYDGLDLGAAPKYDGSDVWPIDDRSVVNGDVTMPMWQMPHSYLVGNTWVSGDRSTVVITLEISGRSFPLTINDAIVTMELSADHVHATQGVIAGVLSTDELVNSMKQFAGSIDPSLCTGPTIDSIVTQLQQASDIMHDGTQDPTQVCDGISIGIGFNAELVQLGAVTTAPPDLPSCP
jgi:hypothetical protein